jgi:hypothetical protein
VWTPISCSQKYLHMDNVSREREMTGGTVTRVILQNPVTENVSFSDSKLSFHNYGTP